MRFFDWIFRRNKPKKITLGLALGSGGAKGFAELGALKAFEENGIEFDVIAGTSIGSIIGAAYANGYSSTDIFSLMETVNIKDVTKFFMIRMDTSGLFNVIDKTLGKLCIEELKKPFMAVATDLDKGEEVVFSEGKLALALSASSSYPPFFKPVIDGERRLIDGAFTNTVPADLVKKMGADYVVGIDLSAFKRKSSGILSKFFPLYKSKIENPSEKGYKYSDIMLQPNLYGYRGTSFTASSEMYDIGYNTANAQMNKIIKDIERLKFPRKKEKIYKHKNK